MSTVSFAGVTLINWQTPKKSFTRATKETELLSGDIHVSRSPKVIEFPKTFFCYAATDNEMGIVEDLINENYSTLIIDGASYFDCYVYQISDIWEVNEGSGKWTYSIEFRQADVY